jgi:hypothetical protein
MTSPFRNTWKETEKWIFTTGDHHTTNELIDFNNLGWVGYFSSLEVDTNRFEDTFVTQLGLKGSLSLYMHTKDGQFVGLCRTCK